MAKRPPKKKPAKKRKQKKPRSYGLLTLVLLVTATMGATLYFVFLRPAADMRDAAPLAPQANLKRRLHYEEPMPPEALEPAISAPAKKQPPKAVAGLPEPESKQPAAESADETGELPLVAIVIDDMGFRRSVGVKFLDLDLNLSFAFLPDGPHTVNLSRQARERGRDVLLHQPMEPTDPRWDPGPDALTLAMDDDAMGRAFKKGINSVPMAVGVNNHMGSRFTQNREAMAAFLDLVGNEKLFFLDSVTSSHSVGYHMAREMGIKTLRRNIFLDNVQDKEAITKQLRALLRVAENQGWAVGIGHPHQATYEALADFKEQLSGRVRLVAIHTLAH